MNKIRFLMFITMAAFAAALYCCRLPEVESQFNMKVLLPLAAGGNPPVTEYIISVSLKGNKYEAHKLFSSTSRTIKMAAPIDEEITISIAAFPAAPSETPTLYFGNFPVNKTERYKVEPINNNVSIELLESQKEMAEGGMIFFIPGTGGSWDEMHVFEFTASNAVQYLTFKKNGIETAPNIYGRLLVVGGGGAGGSSSGVALGAGGGGGGAAVIIDDNFRFNSAKYRITVGKSDEDSLFGDNSSYKYKAIRGGKGGNAATTPGPGLPSSDSSGTAATTKVKGGAGGGASVFNSSVVSWSSGGIAANGDGGALSEGWQGGDGATLAVAGGGGGGQISTGISGDSAPLSNPISGMQYGGYGGHGGNGKSATITGKIVYFGAGGGAGGTKEAGHGGRKGAEGESGSGGRSNFAANMAGKDGVSGRMSNPDAGAGGGGGGGASAGGTANGGQGGKGIVIVRFQYQLP